MMSWLCNIVNIRRRRARERRASSIELDDLPLGIGEYDDFRTIDWQRDLARDHMRRRRLEKNKEDSPRDHMKSFYDVCSSWLCVLLVGLLSGTFAGVIDLGADWMKDLKEGICPKAFWLSRQQCCNNPNDVFVEGNECAEWNTWSEQLGYAKKNTENFFIIYAMYILWSLLLTAIASFLVTRFAPYASGSGIPEIKTILSGFVINGYLGLRTLLVKSFCMMLAVAAGLSLGKEGPLVHVACCVGNIFCNIFPKYKKNEAKKREILSAASAAGVAVAFGAPIAGVLFSLEEVSYYFPMKTLWRSFFCALVAQFVLKYFNAFDNDGNAEFYVGNIRTWLLLELIPFLFLGILGGLVGALFIKGNSRWSKLRKESKLGQYPMVEVLVVTLITAVVDFLNIFTRMDSSDLIKMLFSQCSSEDLSLLCIYNRNVTKHTVTSLDAIDKANTDVYSYLPLTLALLFKLIITIFTFGIKVPAGLFIPCLAMGALMGRMVGMGMQHLSINYRYLWIFQNACPTDSSYCITPGLYAMVGAAALLAGVTRITVTLVVIMFELTASVNFIIPLMSAVMVSKWVGDAFGKEGIYDAHIHINGYPFLDSKQKFFQTALATDVVKPKSRASPLVVITQDSMTVDDIETLLETTHYNGFPVVMSKKSETLVGFIDRKDLTLAIAEARRKQGDAISNSRVLFTRSTPEPWTGAPPLRLRRILDMAPITITDQTLMEAVIDMFRKLGLRQVLVIRNGQLMGIITKKDVLRHINQFEK